MPAICPLCNGLDFQEVNCPRCGEPMTDSGMVEGYFEPYRPYLDLTILQQTDGVAPEHCLHLFSCQGCGHDQRLIIAKINP